MTTEDLPSEPFKFSSSFALSIEVHQNFNHSNFPMHGIASYNNLLILHRLLMCLVISSLLLITSSCYLIWLMLNVLFCVTLERSRRQNHQPCSIENGYSAYCIVPFYDYFLHVCLSQFLWVRCKCMISLWYYFL